jgi:VIT1/CCC1 family predicted Fe2+/Mn2+ transporter
VWKKAVAIAAIAVVAVVALVPWLLYVGVQKLLGDEDIDIDPRKSRARSYNRAARRDEYQRRRGFPVRLFAALVGGASLIVPMVVMSLHPDQTKSLVTTSLFILLFAVLIAWRTSIKPWEVMTSTAAYAAVLVVFTGVSGG